MKISKNLNISKYPTIYFENIDNYYYYRYPKYLFSNLLYINGGLGRYDVSIRTPLIIWRRIRINFAGQNQRISDIRANVNLCI